MALVRSIESTGPTNAHTHCRVLTRTAGRTVAQCRQLPYTESTATHRQLLIVPQAFTFYWPPAQRFMEKPGLPFLGEALPRLHTPDDGLFAIASER